MIAKKEEGKERKFLVVKEAAKKLPNSVVFGETKYTINPPLRPG
jgi:hypothetical protein